MRVSFIAAVAVLAGSLSGAHAQFGSISPSGVNAAFIKLFGPNTTFTARADVRVLDKSGKEWVRMPANVAALDQKIRIGIDMGQVVSRDLPEFALKSLKESGMGEVVSIVRPDRKATFLVYPGAASFLNLPLSPEDARAFDKGYKLQSTSKGSEKLLGKDRARNNVTVLDASGSPVLSAVTWTAPELKNFPVQIETKQDNMTILMKFSNVQFLKPAASQFEVPAGFEEYKDMQKLMFAVMKKIVAGSSPADTK